MIKIFKNEEGKVGFNFSESIIATKGNALLEVEPGICLDEVVVNLGKGNNYYIQGYCGFFKRIKAAYRVFKFLK